MASSPSTTHASTFFNHNAEAHSNRSCARSGSVVTPRPERQSLADRLRMLLGSSCGILGAEQGPLRPEAADDQDEPPLREDV